MKTEAEIIDTAAALKSFLDGLPQDNTKPNLFIDLEGNNLSRHGTLSLITVLVEPRHTVHLIDVHTLGNQAFTLASTANGATTLKNILESVAIAKVFFDIRHDSDALYSLYGISVGGIEDLQLMELASRKGDKSAVSSLSKCVERDAAISTAEKQKWRAIKEEGRALFDSARNGSYAVFDQRPLSPTVERYAAQDVVQMPNLYETYDGLLGEDWRGKVQVETLARIALSQSAGFVDGKHLGKGPAAWIPDGPRRGRGRGRGRPPRSIRADMEQEDTLASNEDLVERERDARLDVFLWE
jgi:exonuclease 3'-5' domain-containing protein 1